MNSNQHIQSLVSGLIITSAILLQGCATNLTKPQGAPQAPTAKFGGFEHVEMKQVQLAPAFAASSANKKAQKKINEVMFVQVSEVLPLMKEFDNKPGSPKGSTLVIEPLIKEIKFIGGMARFWAGALAGSSAVLYQVTFTDEVTGEVLANPEFYQQASAMGGAWSMGGSDNGMLHRICTVSTEYIQKHKDDE